MEKFSVSVNIAAQTNVTFILTYEELLQRKLGQYEILTRVKPKSLVQKFQVTKCCLVVTSSILTECLTSLMFVCVQIVTNIYEPQGLSYVDAHATFLSNELLPLVEKTVSDKKVHDGRGGFSPSSLYTQ